VTSTCTPSMKSRSPKDAEKPADADRSVVLSPGRP
jgi:hypothetical protein